MGPSSRASQCCDCVHHALLCGLGKVTNLFLSFSFKISEKKNKIINLYSKDCHKEKLN